MTQVEKNKQGFSDDELKGTLSCSISLVDENTTRKQLFDLHTKVDVKDLSDPERGIETDPHITVAQKIDKKNFDGKTARAWLEKVAPFQVEFEVVDIKQFGGRDVLCLIPAKTSDALVTLHRDANTLWKTYWPWPEYSPHVTLAYLKSGCGVKYKDILGKVCVTAYVHSLSIKAFRDKSVPTYVIPLSKGSVIKDHFLVQ